MILNSIAYPVDERHQEPRKFCGIRDILVLREVRLAGKASISVWIPSTAFPRASEACHEFSRALARRADFFKPSKSLQDDRAGSL
jgi:hypothetical protein